MCLFVVCCVSYGDQIITSGEHTGYGKKEINDNFLNINACNMAAAHIGAEMNQKFHHEYP